MRPGPARDALTLLVGVASGTLSGVLGVGGAVVSTPGIRALGASAFQAVGTTLPCILPAAVSGSVRYQRERLVDWRVVAWVAPAGVAAAVGGSLLSHAVPGRGHLLMLATAGLLGLTAWRMVRRADLPLAGAGLAGPAGPDPATGPGPPVAAPGDPAPGPGPGRLAAGRRYPAAALAGLGVAAGGLAGLLGVGGGAVLVPAFAEAVRMPLKAAIATSLVCVGVLAIPGTVTHALLGDIDWRFALWLTLGTAPGARLGAAVTVRAGERRLRLAVGGLLGLLAVGYAASELALLLR